MGRASGRKRTAHRAGAEALRELWADREFGIALSQSRGDQLRLTWQFGDPEVTLMGLRPLRQLVDAIEREHVLGLRAVGVSWQDVGFFLGMTGEAARRRHAELERSLERLEEGRDSA